MIILFITGCQGTAFYEKSYSIPTDGWESSELFAYEVEIRDDSDPYDFYINLDNIYLKNEQKNTKGDPVTMNLCFIWGLVLMGISMIHDDIQERKQATRDDNGESVESERMHIEDKVEIFTKAVAPVLLPMIQNLGGIDELEDFADNTAGAAA